MFRGGVQFLRRNRSPPSLRRPASPSLVCLRTIGLLGPQKPPHNQELYVFLHKCEPAGPLYRALPDCRITLACYVKGKSVALVVRMSAIV